MSSRCDAVVDWSKFYHWYVDTVKYTNPNF